MKSQPVWVAVEERLSLPRPALSTVPARWDGQAVFCDPTGQLRATIGVPDVEEKTHLVVGDHLLALFNVP